MTVAVLFPPQRWAHVRGLTDVDWLASWFQTTPPGKLEGGSLYGLCVVLSPKPVCLSLYHRGPNLRAGNKQQDPLL